MNRTTAIKEYAPGLHWKLQLEDPEADDYQASVAALDAYIDNAPRRSIKRVVATEIRNIGTIVNIYRKTDGERLVAGRLVAISRSSVSVCDANNVLYTYDRKLAEVIFRKRYSNTLRHVSMFLSGTAFAAFAFGAWLESMSAPQLVSRMLSWNDVPNAVNIAGMVLALALYKLSSTK